MSLYKILLIILLILILASCENVQVVESEIKFEEKIVVQSELVAEKIFAGVFITKTIPIDEEYNIKNAEIADAVCYIKVNYAQVIPLHYRGNGLYKPKYDIVCRSGYVYELFGQVNENKFYANTYVPFIPEVLSSQLNGSNYIKSELRVTHTDVFGSRWVIKNNSDDIIAQAPAFHSLVQPRSNELFSVFVRTADIPELYLSGTYRNFLYQRIYTFDQPYLEYYKTKGNNEPVDNTFAQSGGPINWNVQGNKAIGLFIGLAEGPYIKVRN